MLTLRRSPALLWAAAFGLLAAACSTGQPSVVAETSPGRTPSPTTATVASELLPTLSNSDGPRRVRAVVVRVIDGDTIDFRGVEGPIRVRLIGVDTPETVHPSEPVECFGKKASAFTRRALAGERVALEYDVELLDRYNRTLAYVWKGDELFNETLLRKGYAQLLTIPPNVKYVDRLRRAQRLAREEGAGLWGACVGEPEPEPSSTPSNGPCHSSYEDVCLDPKASDYDCAGGSGNGPLYLQYRVRVVGPDAFRLDADGDGFGCDTLPPP